MEAIKAQKTSFINENIIEKGYSLEELSNFIIQKLNKPIENLDFEELKEMVEEFKDQGLIDMYQTVKSKNKDIDKTEEEKKFDSMYHSQTYDFKTTPQQENKLLILEREGDKKKLKIQISDPIKKKSGTFFKKSIWSYKIETPSLEGGEARRTYADFEWLQNQLVINYPLRLVTSLVKEKDIGEFLNIDKGENEDNVEKKKIKYLNNFMESILRKKIFRTSPILYEFLILNEDNFKKYKEKISKNKYELIVTLANLKTLKGEKHCEIKPEMLFKAENFNKNYIKINNIYSKLDKNISNIITDFENLEIHMKEASDQFKKLQECFMDNDQSKNMMKIFSRLNIIFGIWSNSYKNQSIFFKEELQNFFKCMNLEFQGLDNIYKSFINFKHEYEDFTTIINRKKEELYESKEYDKWEFQPGTEDMIPMVKENKPVALEKMLYRESHLLREEKKRIAYTIYSMNKQFNKLLKHQSDYIVDYFGNNMKNNQELFIGDALNLIKLFSIDTSNWN